MTVLDWTGITVANGQCEYPDCPWCAKIWFRWLASRMSQMGVPRRNKGETTTFAEAAAGSNVPPRNA